MACRIINVGGSFAIACGPRGKRHTCSAANCTAYSVKQCDYPVKGKKSGTCDRHLCARHAISKGAELDWCEPRARGRAEGIRTVMDEPKVDRSKLEEAMRQVARTMREAIGETSSALLVLRVLTIPAVDVLVEFEGVSEDHAEWALADALVKRCRKNGSANKARSYVEHLLSEALPS